MTQIQEKIEISTHFAAEIVKRKIPVSYLHGSSSLYGKENHVEILLTDFARILSINPDIINDMFNGNNKS
ncbi:MAG: hypothetical protein WCL07_03840 [bacterium]